VTATARQGKLMAMAIARRGGRVLRQPGGVEVRQGKTMQTGDEF
jgi:hypothetical protein